MKDLKEALKKDYDLNFEGYWKKAFSEYNPVNSFIFPINFRALLRIAYI